MPSSSYILSELICEAKYTVMCEPCHKVDDTFPPKKTIETIKLQKN